MSNNGKITINGKLSPFLELGVGFNPELTARENVFLGGAILGLSRKEVAEKFDSIVKFAELEEFIDMKFKNFSSGMQVRLAFALSINVHADILLMDEVLAVGDSNFQQKCLNKFVELKNEKKTIVLVTHSMDNVERYCNKAIYLDKGIVKEFGTPSQIIESYNNDNIDLQEKAEENKETFTKKHKIISALKIMGPDNKERKLFKTGESMILRVEYKFNKIINKPIFGISINKDGGGIVFGTNNEKNNLVIDSSAIGYIDFHFKNIPLLEGIYGVSVAVGNESKLLEKIDNVKTFTINNGGIKDYGICKLSTKVDFKEGEIK